MEDAPFLDPFADKSWAESLGLELVSLELPIKRCRDTVAPHSGDIRASDFGNFGALFECH
ncbi:hypothetical protein [Nostoc sp.]|uniref:hypothetical protein n=1 Tax=Nostoc sp. TaxID=1180 RepID=UPI002FFA573A